MKRVYKYQIETADSQFIEVPVNARILTIQMQNGAPCLWAVVNDDAPYFERREILIVGTGSDMPLNTGDYIGTYQLNMMVFHAFEVK